jgi:hypothetical protein
LHWASLRKVNSAVLIWVKDAAIRHVGASEGRHEMSTFGAIAALVAGGLLAGTAVQLIRWSADAREAKRAKRELLMASLPLPERFDPAMVADLPEPARRFLRFAIQPGTRLNTVAQIRMEGELSLGSKQRPDYQPMHAEQILAAPHGFVWQVRLGRGALIRIAGSDGMVGKRSWTRFWLSRLVPVARAGGDRDHLRSSLGRVVAEAALWTPAFLLPRPGVIWMAVDADTARATVTHLGMTQEVDIRVDAAGKPLWVRIPRWSNANPDQAYRLQPFGGEPSDFRSVQGYQLPFRLEGGNFFGTGEYFPFYRARVTDIRMR